MDRYLIQPIVVLLVLFQETHLLLQEFQFLLQADVFLIDSQVPFYLIHVLSLVSYFFCQGLHLALVLIVFPDDDEHVVQGKLLAQNVIAEIVQLRIDGLALQRGCQSPQIFLNVLGILLHFLLGGHQRKR